MKELIYWEQRDHFAPFAFEPFQKYFPNRSEFDAFVYAIAKDEEKSQFLKVASF